MPSSQFTPEAVAIDLNIKLMLERRLRTIINKFHNKIATQLEQSIRKTGDVQDFYASGLELESILNSHYTLVGEIFATRINTMVLQELDKELVPVGEKNFYYDDLEIKARKKVPKVPIVVDRHFKVKAADIAGKITKTTKKEAKRALAEVKKLARKPGGVGVIPVNVASQTGAMFRTTMNGRATGIVRLNTNAPAEAAKITQVQILRGEQPSLAGGGASKGTKTWSNMADSLVRGGGSTQFNHQTANQTVSIDKPFKVSGESLKFPGDTSMGASAGNVINCRCSATYDIKKVAKKVKAKAKQMGVAPRTAMRQLTKTTVKKAPKTIPKPKVTPRIKSTLPKASKSPEFQKNTLARGKDGARKKFKKLKTFDDVIVDNAMANPAEKINFNNVIRSVDDYVDNSDDINSLMRFGKTRNGKKITTKLKKEIAMIDDAVALGKMEETTTVFRGMEGIEARRLNLKVGSKFTDKGFGSWTGERHVASDFLTSQTELLTASSEVTEGATMLRMQAKKGTNALFIETEQSEFLFKRGMKYRVVEIEEDVIVRKVKGEFIKRRVITVESY